jgi:hypothetical protein
MQVFIVGSPLETARALDKKRLNRQIQEVKVILDALNGAKAWSNHPCVLQYRGYEGWLEIYSKCLELEQLRTLSDDKVITAIQAVTAVMAKKVKPPFHTQEYFDQMKRRLYTKDPEHYAQWADLGKSEENWYWSQELEEWRKYVNGKRVE